MKNRFYEIDSLRGLAITMMIAFHFFFDLKFLGLYSFESDLFWWLFPRLIASTFILLVGVSLTLSYSRVRTRKRVFLKYLLRGLKIFSLGLVITLVTWLFIGKGFVVFGILHLIGLSIILAYPLLKYEKLNLYLGTILMILGWYLSTLRFDFSWLLWLGFIPESFYSVDYVPLLPWFGLVPIGIFLGKMLYPNGKRCFKIAEFKNPLVNFFSFLGRNSLLIYLIHQPLIVALITVLS